MKLVTAGRNTAVLWSNFCANIHANSSAFLISVSQEPDSSANITGLEHIRTMIGQFITQKAFTVFGVCVNSTRETITTRLSWKKIDHKLITVTACAPFDQYR